MDADTPPPSTAASAGRLAALLVLTLLACGITYVVIVLTLAEECGLLGPPPASASPQGGTCGEHGHVWAALPWAVGLVGVVVPPYVTWWAWRSADGATAVLTAFLSLIGTGLGASIALSAPPDDCSAEQRRTLPRWQCHNPDSSDRR